MQPKPPLKPRNKRGEKRRKSIEEIEDRKFKDDLEHAAFISRIEREANEEIPCPKCGDSNWRVHHKHQQVNVITNEIVVTMTCRKCGKRMPFATLLDPTGEEEDDDWAPLARFGSIRR